MNINKNMIVWCGDSLMDDIPNENAPTVAEVWDYGYHHYSWIVSNTLDAKYENTAISGDTIANIDTNMQTRILDYNPTLLVIEGGVNDCGVAGATADATTVHMTNVIQTALSQNIQVCLIWIPVNVASWSAPNQADFLTLRSKYVAMANSFNASNPDSFLFIDLEGTKLGTTSASASTIPQQYRVDGLHFNTGGLMAVAEEVLCQILDADTNLPAKMPQTRFIPRNDKFTKWEGGSVTPTGDYVYTWTPAIHWEGIAGGVEKTFTMSASEADYTITDSGKIVEGFATLGGE